MSETIRTLCLPAALPPGLAFLQGDEACAEGAIAAGCTYYAGYPITPASEIMEHICWRFAELPGRVFIQMEDEIASIASCIGASWAGALAMTATSGPGLSLMLENLGYALITETPLVIVDVQRAGPSTGQATRPAQGDVLQARHGASGDYELIAVAPWSVREMYSETIRAFNLAERFRVPVIVLADEAVGHLRESLTIEPTVHVCRRCTQGGRPPFGDAEVPPMPALGQGEKLLVTGSTHDAWGYRRTSSAVAQAALVERLVRKVQAHEDEICRTIAYHCADQPLETLLIAYGFTARSALRAVVELRRQGRRLGLLRLATLWPFPARDVARHAEAAGQVIVAEMNRGQMLREVQRIVPHAKGYQRTDGEVIEPHELVDTLKQEGAW
jgi:2-oxoglutarate ferredoxin oxidoreductase subunit alpha